MSGNTSTPTLSFPQTRSGKLEEPSSRAKKSGWQRIQFILDKNGKATVSTADHDGTKFTREENTENHVLAVLAAIATKTPLSIFDNLHMKRYI